MNRNHLLILCATLTLACDGDPADDLEAEPTEADTGAAAFEGETEQSDGQIHDADDPRLADAAAPAAASSTDPSLRWVLYSEPGVARLVRVDAATGVATTPRTWTFSSHWVPIGIAGDKLLWQRSDTDEVSLWTIDVNGGYVSHVVFQPPAGWRARGITLDQEGQCPMPPAAQTTTTILFERPPTSYFYLPPPVLWHLDHAGVVDSTESFPTSYPWAELRDFRLTADGYGALIHRNSFAFEGDGTAIDWYGRDDDGNLLRLRTDTYSAAQGNVGCTPHEPDVQCFFDTADEAPGAGHELTSMVTTRTAGNGPLPASYLLWTKADGTAKSYRLGLYGGKLLAPAAPISTPHAGSEAVSFTGQSPAFCPIAVPPQAPPELPGDPVLDPPGCIWCG